MKHLNINEIFYSIQGEGIYVGLPTLFVRFETCNLDCDYCDTKRAKKKSKSFKMYDIDGNIYMYSNPISTVDFMSIISNYTYKFLSFTGGEPLICSNHIEEILASIQPKDKSIMLETNGTLYESVTKFLLENIDIWSIDIKLPSVYGNKFNKDIKDAQEKFFDKMSFAKRVILKAVFDGSTPINELKYSYKKALDIYNINKNTTLIYQPVTRDKKIKTGKNIKIILKDIINKNETNETGLEIRIIPQIHKMLKIM